MNRWLRRASRWILLAVLGLVLGYEEVQWRLSIVFALLGKLPVFRAVERHVKSLPPYGALALFVLPSAILFPLKLLALYWLAGGNKTLGIGTILIAKVMGTALVARIFQLTREALLTIGWCQWLYGKVMSLRQAAYAIWQSLPVARWWRARWAKEKALGGFWKRRWKALRERFGNRAVKIR